MPDPQTYSFTFTLIHRLDGSSLVVSVQAVDISSALRELNDTVDMDLYRTFKCTVPVTAPFSSYGGPTMGVF